MPDSIAGITIPEGVSAPAPGSTPLEAYDRGWELGVAHVIEWLATHRSEYLSHADANLVADEIRREFLAADDA